MAGFRERAQNVTGRPARLHWLVRIDPQIEQCYGSATYALDRYAARIEALRAAGDVIGLHPHLYRWESDRWLVDSSSPTWIEHCMGLAVETYKQHFGEAAEVLRMGDAWLDTTTANLAERLGIRYELSIEPGFRMRHDSDINSRGPLADYRWFARSPYQPDRDALAKPLPPGASRLLWAIPLSSARIVRPDLAGHLDALRRDGWRYRQRPRMLKMYQRGVAPNRFADLLDRALRETPMPYLALAFRTDQRSWDIVGENLQSLLSHPLAGRMDFCTVADFVARHCAAGRPVRR
ncbi:MAG: hypothetical protein KDG50_11545 [Chromatiales bacterium]|nr:hypothetical protein [Chromatiales bacterium]